MHDFIPDMPWSMKVTLSSFGLGRCRSTRQVVLSSSTTQVSYVTTHPREVDLRDDAEYGMVYPDQNGELQYYYGKNERSKPYLDRSWGKPSKVDEIRQRYPKGHRRHVLLH